MTASAIRLPLGSRSWIDGGRDMGYVSLACAALAFAIALVVGIHPAARHANTRWVFASAMLTSLFCVVYGVYLLGYWSVPLDGIWIGSASATMFAFVMTITRMGRVSRPVPRWLLAVGFLEPAAIAALGFVLPQDRWDVLVNEEVAPHEWANGPIQYVQITLLAGLGLLVIFFAMRSAEHARRPLRWLLWGIAAVGLLGTASEMFGVRLPQFVFLATTALLAVSSRLAETELTTVHTSGRSTFRLPGAHERDGLTGALNRASLDEYLTISAANALKTRTPLSILLVDLNRFKAVNDEYGHLVGDEFLTAVATRIGQGVGRRGVVGRYGGDEFIVVLPRTALAEAGEVAAAIRAAAEAPLDLGGVLFVPSLSIGAAEHTGGGLSELLGAADAEMYANKHGRTGRRTTDRRDSELHDGGVA